VGSAVVLSDLQPPRLEIFLPDLALLVLKRRRHRIVPTIEKTERRDHADDFRDPFFGSVLAQFREHIVGHRIGH